MCCDAPLTPPSDRPFAAPAAPAAAFVLVLLALDGALPAAQAAGVVL